MMQKKFLEHWMVSLALLAIVAVVCFGASQAGYYTGPSVFSWFRKDNEGFTPVMAENSITDRVKAVNVNAPVKRDPMSSAVASKDCVGKSSGLTTSSGGVCLTPELKQLLSTRGNNATFDSAY
jgi:hypothetical protein